MAPVPASCIPSKTPPRPSCFKPAHESAADVLLRRLSFGQRWNPSADGELILLHSMMGHGCGHSCFCGIDWTKRGDKATEGRDGGKRPIPSGAASQALVLFQRQAASFGEVARASLFG